MTGKISIIGSTGSIGTQTLEVARDLGVPVVGLAARSSTALLAEQIREFRPEAAAVIDAQAAAELKKLLASSDAKTEIYHGKDGYNIIAGIDSADTVVSAAVGAAGLAPTFEAVRRGKKIALANKEVLVAAGQLMMAEARKRNVEILPVDSEHSAIFQCIGQSRPEDVLGIILTASGGPFRKHTHKMLDDVTFEQSMQHPTWKMGGKITVDSATLMNKGFEVIEAQWLFGLPLDKVRVLIHPQSVIHSMVEFVDGSVLAQLGPADMRLPIQYALTYPERRSNPFRRLDFNETRKLTFDKPDLKKFPCLRLAYDAAAQGGTLPAAMNAANECAVGMFMKGKIRFKEIPHYIEKVMSAHDNRQDPDLEAVLEADAWARRRFDTEVSK